ncbi:MAG: hypothetical protein U0M23_09825 [Acutalibacteraceae bacterium]|nr:hypothetical protein [Acutalibacteraceae bacterium]
MSESSSYFDLAGRLEESFAEIEDAITVDLRENDENYRSLYQSISDLKAKYPFIQTVIEGAGGLTLSAEEHEILANYFKLQFRLESMERQQIYFRGHTDCFSYLKKIGAF